ncbi:four-carbon acid sugar kinase family protein [Oryzifoliimicrobium ureilyticus]|uniref:four-carbon acid sugar kinase family protein n=1 Tax=Oryzifoliimicrobium ureilyticus TaxID=3113724 RepID=UPI0030764C85
MTNLLLSYYGDDFTGSTDVMEALASRGVSTVLFLGIPTTDMRRRFADCRAMGIAGTSRSETPGWMEANLGPAFEWLRSLSADVTHYKVCSTFDSSPGIGSVGRAIEIGRELFQQSCVPLVVGAPQLKRYTCFGNLFAAYQGHVYRIDRHPVMSRHPVTPMDEADLVRHLSKQTELPIALADLATLVAPRSSQVLDKLVEEASVLMLDVDGPQTQHAVGRELWRLVRKGQRFVVGSSGIEYALLEAWREEGLLGEAVEFAPPGKVERLAVVSGSVSPTTERQIRAALKDGFDGIDLDPVSLLSDPEAEIRQALERAERVLRSGRSVILHTALGPKADRGADIDHVAGARHLIGQYLGDILRRLVESEGLPRAVIAGGDTSSHALKKLHVDALTTLLPLPQTPGSPLCTAHGAYPPTDGLQIALKGGQVGGDDYFSQIRDGQSHR